MESCRLIRLKLLNRFLEARMNAVAWLFQVQTVLSVLVRQCSLVRGWNHSTFLLLDWISPEFRMESPGSIRDWLAPLERKMPIRLCLISFVCLTTVEICRLS